MARQRDYQREYRAQLRRALDLGFGSVRAMRQERKTVEYRTLVAGEEAVQRQKIFALTGKYGPTKLSPQQRASLFEVYAHFRGTDLSDKGVRGGNLDRYLQALGRRDGKEAWGPGETP